MTSHHKPMHGWNINNLKKILIKKNVSTCQKNWQSTNIPKSLDFLFFFLSLKILNYFSFSKTNYSFSFFFYLRRLVFDRALQSTRFKIEGRYPERDGAQTKIFMSYIGYCPATESIQTILIKFSLLSNNPYNIFKKLFS